MVTGGGERGVGGSFTPPASAHQPGPRGACVRGCRAQELQACLGAQGNHSVGWNQLWGLGSPGLSFPFLTLQGYFCPLHRPTPASCLFCPSPGPDGVRSFPGRHSRALLTPPERPRGLDRTLPKRGVGG